MVAICQMRHSGSAGRVYVDRKVAEGKTKRAAIRALKRHISNAVYRQLVIDARRTAGNKPRRRPRLHSGHVVPCSAWLPWSLV